ncbi:hypothetical protein PMAYCL1PPCAC_08322, partial [Pristionchus mayeri]
MEALFFWIDALSRASKNEDEVNTPARSYLNRKLVAAMIIRTSPISLVQHRTDVPDPCPDNSRAITLLKMIMKKCDVVKLNVAMNKYFGEALHCGVCVEYKRIDDACTFITHISTSKHIVNATRYNGQMSKKVLRFWLDALCESGAVVLPEEKEEVKTLFG